MESIIPIRIHSSYMEPAGVVVGGLSLAAMLTTGIDCFNYMRVARSCGEDFASLQTKLECIRYRLSTWAEAAGVNSQPPPMFTAVDATPKQELLVENCIKAIKGAIERAMAISQKLGSDDPRLLDHSTHDLHQEPYKERRLIRQFFHNLTSRKSRGTPTTAQKFFWAISDRATFDRLVDDMDYQLEQIVKIIPDIKKAYDTATHEDLSDLGCQLAKLSGSEREEALRMLCATSPITAPDEQSFVADAVNAASQVHIHKNNTYSGKTDTHNGNVFGPNYQGNATKEGKQVFHFEGNNYRDDSKTHNGNRYE